METAEASAPQIGTGAATLAAMLVDAAGRYEGPAIRYEEGGEWRDVSFGDLGAIVRELARGLLAAGLEPGERVAILSDTRPEWAYADLAALCAGAVVVPVYHTSPAEEIRHVLGHSGARLLFCEDRDQLEKVTEVRDELPCLEQVVLLAGDGGGQGSGEGGGDGQGGDGDGAISLAELREGGGDVGEERIDERIAALGPDDLATVVYTSGTTGPPKGVMLTHRNLRCACEAYEQVVDPGEDPVFYAFLPLAHVLTRVVELVSIDVGATLAFWRRDKSRLLDDLAELRPTHFSAVPRIFEKIYNEARGKRGEGLQGKVLDKAVEVGRRVRALERAGRAPGPILRAEHELADRRVLSKVRETFGGRLRLAFTGAAPVAREMLEFLDGCGVLVLEGYGLTETSAAATMNRPDDPRFGTVGRPLPGVELRIAADRDGDQAPEGTGEQAPDGDGEQAPEGTGEILVRGPQVFAGYLDAEQETGEALDADGWFHTEDLGELDDEGLLRITGRTKDIIVTSSGKNISPANIENRLSDHPYVSHAVVYGDDRPYLTALITIDEDERSKLAERAGSSDDPGEMAEHEGVREQLQQVVDEANRDFARIEQVKKFAILERDLSQEEGELTPTMKPKRGVVHERHEALLERLYEEDG
ncbi:MAG: long-chain fatty acid--CoA ligase [Actinomycetota bacterium]|nr:long-chain fatty acid--CoA ligase [Actinomycetota bacterium]